MIANRFVALAQAEAVYDTACRRAGALYQTGIARPNQSAEWHEATREASEAFRKLRAARESRW